MDIKQLKLRPLRQQYDKEVFFYQVCFVSFLK